MSMPRPEDYLINLNKPAEPPLAFHGFARQGGIASKAAIQGRLLNLAGYNGRDVGLFDHRGRALRLTPLAGERLENRFSAADGRLLSEDGKYRDEAEPHAVRDMGAFRAPKSRPL